MVAQLKAAAPSPLPLLLEPDQPSPAPSGHRYTRGNATGWKREDGVLVRQPLHDRHGALIQHVLVRYYVHRVQRQVIAQEIDYSERQISAWLAARNGATYAEPVRRALMGLGIELWRGQRERKGRAEELIAAHRTLLESAAWLLATDTRPEAVRVRTLARLLSAGREPLGGRP